MLKTLAAFILGATAAFFSPAPFSSALAQQGAGNALTPFAGSMAPTPDPASLTMRGAVYVPAYSSIRIGSGKTTLDLATTLSIHNVSDSAPLVLEKIDYFDTAGSLVERYLPKPIAIRPFGTVEIFVPKEDTRGGTGANFLISWAATGAMPDPVIETVMIGAIGNNSYSFVSQGRAIRPSGAK
jgi:hypothetical protein